MAINKKGNKQITFFMMRDLSEIKFRIDFYNESYIIKRFKQPTFIFKYKSIAYCMLFPFDTIKPAIIVKKFSVIRQRENLKLNNQREVSLYISLSLFHVNGAG